MADHQQRATERLQLFFQQFDRWHVEVVGRLVKQQDVRVMRERMGEGDAARLSARCIFQRQVQWHAPCAKLGFGPVHHVFVQTFGHVVQRRRITREIRLLQKVPRDDARLHEFLASVRLDRAAEDAHQGGFARPVAADQRHALSPRQREVDPREQGRSAKREHHAAKNNNRRSGHARMDPNRGGRSSFAWLSCRRRRSVQLNIA